jgi:predicted outer membrane repeat protein
MHVEKVKSVQSGVTVDTEQQPFITIANTTFDSNLADNGGALSCMTRLLIQQVGLIRTSAMWFTLQRM